MGVDYRPILAIGKLFDDEREALEFLKDNLDISAGDLEEIEKDGLEEYCLGANTFRVEGGRLNNYCSCNYGFWIGTELSPRSEDFSHQLYEAVGWWRETFESEPETIYTVVVY